MHAHLSGHRQAEYAPLACRLHKGSQVRLPLPRTADKIGPAGQEAESPSWKPARRRISITEMFNTSFHYIMPTAYTAKSNTGQKQETENGMAQKVNVLLIDDIDGSDAVETIQFGLDGTHYEIDVNSDHGQQLREGLEPYVKKARKVTGAAGRSNRVRRTAANDAENKKIRAWARERHLDVNERGRIPGDIVAQYEAANGR
jgi:hypothetical protein